jgi:hypothetical protein
VLKTYFEIPAASLACNSHWHQEHQRLISFDGNGVSSLVQTRVADSSLQSLHSRGILHEGVADRFIR